MLTHNHSELPYRVSAATKEVAYGVGDNDTEQVDCYQLLNANGRVTADAINSQEMEVHHENCDNEIRAWDAQGKGRFRIYR